MSYRDNTRLTKTGISLTTPELQVYRCLMPPPPQLTSKETIWILLHIRSWDLNLSYPRTCQSRCRPARLLRSCSRCRSPVHRRGGGDLHASSSAVQPSWPPRSWSCREPRSAAARGSPQEACRTNTITGFSIQFAVSFIQSGMVPLSWQVSFTRTASTAYSCRQYWIWSH